MNNEQKVSGSLMHKDIEVLRNELIKREKTARRKSMIALFAIVFLVITAIMLVIFASRVTSGDINVKSEISELNRQKNRIESIIEDYTRASNALSDINMFMMTILNSLQEPSEVIIPSSKQTDPRKLRQFLDENPTAKRKYVKAYDSFIGSAEGDIARHVDEVLKNFPPNWGVVKFRYKKSFFRDLSSALNYWVLIKEDIEANEKRIESNFSRLKEYNEILKAILKRKLDYYSSQSGMISTNLIRVGVTLVLLFFSHFFLSIYRYNTRLESHYGAIIDSLILAKDVKSLECLVSVLQPSRVDFGQVPFASVDSITSSMGISKRS
ncbi:hypothetical protein [Aliikangiella sp. G2MR2-5]|uniref:hypothetical protein n=1 Tax=Aliikangiella sp. G2MR2-5 TaxID=2788943 RepID=UPI0018AB04E8|nr:hypothetical protein [Aliikangiella sp. G2MR2-5]